MRITFHVAQKGLIPYPVKPYRGALVREGNTWLAISQHFYTLRCYCLLNCIEVNQCVDKLHDTPRIFHQKLLYMLNQRFHGNKREPCLHRKYYVLYLTAKKMYHRRSSSNMSTRWYYGCSFRVPHRNFVTRLSTLH